MVKKLTILENIEPFLSNPTEKLHLNDLAKTLNINHTTLRLDLNFLAELGILRKESKGRLTLYSLNFDCPLLGDYLVLSEKNKLIKKAEKDLYLKEFLLQLNRELKEDNLVLVFGSAVDSVKSASDIDLVIVGDFGKNKLIKIESHLNKKIHLIAISSLRKISGTLKKEIIKKHLLVQGSEQIIRWFLSQN